MHPVRDNTHPVPSREVLGLVEDLIRVHGKRAKEHERECDDHGDLMALEASSFGLWL